MRIALDYRPALKPNSRRRGIGRFTRELTQALLECADRPPLLLYTLPGSESNVPRHPAVTWRAVPYLRRPSRLNWILEAFCLPRRIRADGIDLLHSLDPVAAPHRPQERVLWTVHDLIPYIFAEETRRNVPWDFRVALRWAWRGLRRAAHVVAISEATRRDLVRWAGLPEERIYVVPPGSAIPPPGGSVMENRRRAAAELGLPDRFLLYVGGTDFRKNLGFLMEGFARVCAEGYEGELVLVGETFVTRLPEVVRLRRQAEALGVAARVHWLDWIPDDRLAVLYRAADALVFPSLYEGFGLPVLEAMRCGGVVLAARTSAVPEVGGDVAYYFDPGDVESFAATFAAFRAAPEERGRRRELGRRRAAAFTWERSAARLLEIYREICGAPKAQREGAR
ncbi:MAG: glycosyltransferase family 1 protein [Acidobacteriota bacterium]